jgi:hypothetical protein
LRAKEQETRLTLHENDDDDGDGGDDDDDDDDDDDEFVSGSEPTLYILARIKLFLVTIYIEKLTTYLYLLRSVVFIFKQLENTSSFDKINFI